MTYATILNQNKLNGRNYIGWKHDLYLVLTIEEYIIVLREECPIPPDETPTGDETRACNAWKKTDQIVGIASKKDATEGEIQKFLNI